MDIEPPIVNLATIKQREPRKSESGESLSQERCTGWNRASGENTRQRETREKKNNPTSETSKNFVGREKNKKQKHGIAYDKEQTKSKACISRAAAVDGKGQTAEWGAVCRPLAAELSAS